MNKYVFLFEEVNKLAVMRNSLYRDVQKCRDDLLELLDNNNWFGMSIKGKGLDVQVITNQEAYNYLELWLDAYNKNPEEKLFLLMEHFRVAYPRTTSKLKEFIYSKGIQDKDCGYQLLDFIYYAISDDNDLFTDGKAKHVLEKAEMEISIVSTQYLSEFIMNNSASNLSWHYTINKRKASGEEDAAYSVRDFSIMAYCVFNEANWKKEHMIEKAVENKKYADVWLFVALHFICGLRRTDMVNLPVPIMPENVDVVREKLLTDKADDVAIKVSDEWAYRLEMLSTRPSKTARFSDIANIKVFVPESLRLPVGIILLTVLLHHKEGEAFFEIKNEHYILKNFFGDSFMKACRKGRFNTRSANKAYLQGIERTGDDGISAKGYILAALARSHKGNIGNLPEMTDAYLKDANFSGYKPDFILREMFERGIFGFIPVMLMKIYAEEDFLKLSVSEQTELIKSIGLSAKQIEDIFDISKRALNHVNDSTGLIFRGALSDRKSVENILLKLVSNRAIGKDNRYMCLRIASGDKCIYTDRDSCLGCGYEIYTKAAFYSIVKQYQVLNMKMKNSNSDEADRYRKILKMIVIPAIQEILNSINVLYPASDKGLFLDILEGGINRCMLQSTLRN